MTIKELEKSIYDHSGIIQQFNLQEEIKNDRCRHSLIMVYSNEMLLVWALERELNSVVAELSGIKNWINDNPDIKKRFDATELLCPNYEEVEKFMDEIKEKES